MECCGYMIHDDRVGDLICSNCGKLERNLVVTPKNYSLKSHDFIETVCSNNHIAKVIEEEAIFQYFKERKNKNDTSFAAYCIYAACKAHNAGRSLLEIAKMCYLDVGEITRPNYGEIDISPSEIAERALEKLDLSSFSFKNEVKELSDILFNDLLRCSPPQSALAVAITALCNAKEISHTQVARACDTSPSCLRRLCRIYKCEIENERSLFKKRLKKALFYQTEKNL